MAERRSIYKKITLSMSLENVSERAQLFFTWSIPQADDYGLLPRDSRVLRGMIFPLKESITADDVEKIIEECLSEGLYIIVEVEGKEYLMIRHFLEHQTLRRDRQPQVCFEFKNESQPSESWQKLDDMFKSCLSNDNQRPSEVGHSHAEVKRSEVKRREEKRSPTSETSDTSKKKIPKYTEEDMHLVELFKSLIIRNNPDWRMTGKETKWAEDINKIHRIDKRTYEQIRYMIEWTQKHEFWSQNILSASKLRKQFNDLIPKVMGDRKKKGKTIIGLNV